MHETGLRLFTLVDVEGFLQVIEFPCHDPIPGLDQRTLVENATKHCWMKYCCTKCSSGGYYSRMSKPTHGTSSKTPPHALLFKHLLVFISRKYQDHCIKCDVDILAIKLCLISLHHKLHPLKFGRMNCDPFDVLLVYGP